MSAVLDIDHWSTRIRSTEPALAQTLAGGMRQWIDRLLTGMLATATRQALSRAGLPTDAAVALRRLELTLLLSGAVDPRRLTEDWAAVFTETLAARLAGVPAGEAAGRTPDEGGELIWFADHWAAEYRHLERCAAGLSRAWWAPELAAGGGTAAQLTVDAVIHRWLAADATRSLASLTALVTATPAIVRELDSRQAAALTGEIFRRLLATTSKRYDSAAAGTSSLAGAASGQPVDEAFPAAALAAIEPLRCALAAVFPVVLPADETAVRAAPWLLAALLTGNPALSRLPPTVIENALITLWRRETRMTTRSSPVPASVDRPDGAGRPVTGTPQPTSNWPGPPGQVAPGRPVAAIGATVIDGSDVDSTSAQPILFGGLLLLIRPLIAAALLPPAEELPTALADLALLALRRVLSTLPRGEREVAEEGERPLLTVFAPQGDWRERIAGRPIQRPAAAERLLEALLAQVPVDLAAVAGAERRLFGPLLGSHPARFASEAERRLARLLLRPGELRVNRWQAEMFWPLSAVDPLLRRAGWDQDPGWVPWLGRRIVFHFGVTP